MSNYGIILGMLALINIYLIPTYTKFSQLYHKNTEIKKIEKWFTCFSLSFITLMISNN